MRRVKQVGFAVVLALGADCLGGAVCAPPTSIPQTPGFGGSAHGQALAFEENTIAVGDSSANGFAGAVHLSTAQGGAWSSLVTIHGGVPGEQFGADLSMSGNWLASAAVGGGAGMIDLYYRGESGWAWQGRVEPPLQHVFTISSLSVAIDGAWLAVAMVVPATGEAVVGMYYYDAGVWTYVQRINFGAASDISLDMDDGLLVIGLPTVIVQGSTESGYVLIYEFSDTFQTWVLLQNFQPTGGTSWTRSGRIVSTQNGRVAYSIGGVYDTGGAWPYPAMEIMDRIGETWQVVGSVSFVSTPTQLQDIDIRYDEIGVSSWVPSTGATSTRLYGVASLPSIELIDFIADGVGHSQVELYDGMVLYDLTNSYMYREARVAPIYDCDANGLMDDCEIEDEPSLDCDLDGVLDSCAIADGSVEDCNENGIPDLCDIANGGDANGDGLLDECECSADIAGPDGPGFPDGIVGTDDLLTVIGYWGSSQPNGDVNGDGIVGTDDLLAVIGAWGPCE